MKNFIIATLLLASSQAYAFDLPTHRFVFEIPESAGTIRKMQVDFTDKKGVYSARAKCQNADGKSETVLLKCSKLEKQEFNCHRDDNGGSFDLVLEPTPKIRVGRFSADDEDVENDVLFLNAKDNKLVVVEGKKATISPKDAF